jgi:cyclophilin family peptidyl-prolyl cis-trans isomerase
VGTEKRERQKANRQLKYQQQAKVEQKQKLTKRIVIGVGAVVGLLALVLFLAWAFGDDDDGVDTLTADTAASVAPTSPGTVPSSTPSRGAPAAFTYGTGACPPAEVTTPVKTFDDAPQQCIDPAKSYTARIVTDHGDIVIALDTTNSPGTVNNFVTLARYGYYDDTTIFRGSDGIDIIQGGGTSSSDQFSYTIPDEGSGYSYPEGKIAMANTGSPNSAGAQWFLTTGPDSANLDALGTYAVFGDIVEGLDVAQEILALAQPDETLSETVNVSTIEITES